MRYPPPVVPGYVSHFLRFAEHGDPKDGAGYTGDSGFGLPYLDPDGYPYVYAGRGLYFYSTHAIDGWRDDYRVLVVLGPPVMLDQANPGTPPVPVVAMTDAAHSSLVTPEAKARLAAVGNGTPAHPSINFGAADDAADGGNSEFYMPVFIADGQMAKLRGGYVLLLPEKSVDPVRSTLDPADQFGGTEDLLIADQGSSFDDYIGYAPDSNLGLAGPHYVGVNIVNANDSSWQETASYPTLTTPTIAVPVRYVALCVPAPELIPGQVSASVTFRPAMSLDGE